MNARLVLLALALAACGSDDGSPPITSTGTLKGEVLTGRTQRVVAATKQAAPDRVTYRAYRERTTGNLLAAGGAANATITIQLQPNAIACVGEDQLDLVPFTRCVNTDSLGQSRFDFPTLPTKSGRFVAKLNATFGLEASTFDSVVVVVDPAVPDPAFKFDAVAERGTPAVFLPAHVTDKFGNAVAYRITSDSLLTPADTVLGSAGARTVSFTQVDSIWRTVLITGAASPVARMSYRTVGLKTAPRIQAVFCGLNEKPCVSDVWKP